MFWPLFARIHESMKKRQGGTTRLQILSQAKKNKEVLRVIKNCHRLFLSKTKRCYKKATHALSYSMHISFVHMLNKLRPNTVSRGMIWTWAMASGHAECHANCFF